MPGLRLLLPFLHTLWYLLPSLIAENQLCRASLFVRKSQTWKKALFALVLNKITDGSNHFLRFLTSSSNNSSAFVVGKPPSPPPNIQVFTGPQSFRWWTLESSTTYFSNMHNIICKWRRAKQRGDSILKHRRVAGGSIAQEDKHIHTHFFYQNRLCVAYYCSKIP